MNQLVHSNTLSLQQAKEKKALELITIKWLRLTFLQWIVIKLIDISHSTVPTKQKIIWPNISKTMHLKLPLVSTHRNVMMILR